jgi:hypothetical protein
MKTQEGFGDCVPKEGALPPPPLLTNHLGLLYRKFRFGVTVFYSVMNCFHIIADLLVNPIDWHQIALMVIEPI